jgi:hypothetical protein
VRCCRDVLSGVRYSSGESRGVCKSGGEENARKCGQRGIYVLLATMLVNESEEERKR